MKKLLTLVLALVAVTVLIGLGAAQQARSEQPGRTPRVSQVYSRPIERLVGLEGGANPAAMEGAPHEEGVPGVSKAMPPWKCTCVASMGGWNSGIVYNYGVINTYPTLTLNPGKKCSDDCSDLVSGKKYIDDAMALCAKVNWSGGCVRGYGYIGALGTNNADGTAGKLMCTAPVAAVTQQKCPAGWACNGCSPQVDGGVTSDGKCKKAACGPISISPYPPNGTQIGSWGFSWDNVLYAWGTAANGGKPTTIVVSPAIPGSGSWATCP